MPRVKSTDQIETLERQRRELLAKLKEAKANARTIEREKRLEKARVVGLAVLDELEQNPESESTRNLLTLLDARLTRRVDRESFGLPDRDEGTKAEASSVAPVEGVAESARGELNGFGSDIILQAVERALTDTE
jgi:hypothetical protein